MGVSDLNKIVRDFPRAKSKQDYEYVIIDYSNLITVLLMRHLSVKAATLPRTNEIVFTKWVVKGEGLIVCDVHQQTERLTNAVIDDTMNMLTRLVYPSLREIILVVDPTGAYDYHYVYNDETKMSCVDVDLFNHWLELRGEEYAESYDITFNSKEKEKAIRNETKKKAKLPIISIINKENSKTLEINDYTKFSNSDELLSEFEDLDEVSVKEFKRICTILHHCTYFLNKNNAFGITRIIKSEIIKRTIDRENIRFLCSQSEADVFIKAYFSKYIKDKQTLIVSNDTDYDILFGEIECVDVCLVSPFNPREAVNPYSYWTALFDTEDKRMLKNLLARISALLGNDYTCHERRIVCDSKTIEFVPRLFNINGSVALPIEARSTTNIFKLFARARLCYSQMQRENESEEILEDADTRKPEVAISDVHTPSVTYASVHTPSVTYAHVDKSITDNDEYFKGYYETLLIYLNYQQYVHSSEIETISDKERNEIEKSMADTIIDFTGLLYDDCISKF